jgi:translocation and assembly module TamA
MGLAEVGGAPPGASTRKFLRAMASASLFVPLSRRDDLLLRGELGEVRTDSRQGIPSTFLFRTGGDQTVRGYAYQSLGVPQLEGVVGARYLAVGSIEYTRWIGDNWGLAAFMDAGDAWDPDHSFQAAKGYGVGARFRTPIGPIRADLAYGERTQEYRLHFSVGYTF